MLRKQQHLYALLGSTKERTSIKRMKRVTRSRRKTMSRGGNEDDDEKEEVEALKAHDELHNISR